MPILQRDGVSIYYEVHGSGYPLLLLAPGGMNSVAQMWRESPAAPGQPMPWIDPREVLSDRFTVIAMDQRNAGSSTAPIGPADGWTTFAGDHLALLDHLGFDRAHALGGCIGSSYVLGLCQAAPQRVTAGVLQNPIGLTADNRDRFIGMYDAWAAELSARRRDVDERALASFGQNMFGGEFVLLVSFIVHEHEMVLLLVEVLSGDFLDFGRFEMHAERGVVAEAGSGRLWRLKIA